MAHLQQVHRIHHRMLLIDISASKIVLKAGVVSYGNPGKCACEHIVPKRIVWRKALIAGNLSEPDLPNVPHSPRILIFFDGCRYWIMPRHFLALLPLDLLRGQGRRELCCGSHCAGLLYRGFSSLFFASATLFLSVIITALPW